MLSCRTFVFFYRKKFKCSYRPNFLFMQYNYFVPIHPICNRPIYTVNFIITLQILLTNAFNDEHISLFNWPSVRKKTCNHLKHSRATDNWASRASGPPRIGYTYTIRMYPGTYVILHLVHTQSVEQPRCVRIQDVYGQRSSRSKHSGI
jgi:hypothetical protein